MLSATRWQRVQQLLGESLEQPAEAREAFLDSASAEDSVLRDEVRHLLRAYDEAPTFLERNVLDFAEPLLPDQGAKQRNEFQDCTNQLIGPYQLISEIGQGGMGVVYKARRVDGVFDQDVAIKLLPQCHNEKINRDRFHQEQQVLASLNHPNIARLYDGGITSDGQLYIVMEYVEGVPITDYCEQHHLDISDRLQFVQQIAASLQHAHSNLIVHRDIKPSNILTTKDGTIKLLDFGIAKLLDTHERSVDLTHTGDHMLTPGFAAPEQIVGQPITVATDVYQLGVVLYELLAGQRPFCKADSFYEMARVVCNDAPDRPSDKSFDNSSAETITRDENWTGALRGDLDAIALKALCKKPCDRYASMEAFSADLHAYRHALPVTARQQSATYRATKFIRRHALGALAAVLIMALTISYAVTVTVQSKKIETALNQARIEAGKSQQVASLLTDVFKVSDPNVPGSQQMTAGQILDQGRTRLDKELSDAPEVRAQMQHVLGEIYYSLGAYDESVELLESALQLRRQWLPVQDLAIASSLTQLAFSYNATDQYEKAQQSLQQALAIHRLYSTESVEQAEILNALGDVQRVQANHEEAEALFLEAIAILRRVTDGNHSELATGLQGLAMLQLVNGDARNAEVNSREAVRIVKHSLGEEHSYYTVGLNGLGLLLAYLERYDEAEPLHLEALEIQRRILGEKHPYVSQTFGYLGFLAHRRGLLEASEQHYRDALEIQKELDGGNSATIARLLGQLATVLTKRGIYSEAESAITTALRIDREIFAPSSPMVGRDLAKRAALAHARGALVIAKKDYVDALALLPPKNSRTAEAQLGYATLLLQTRQFADAESAALEALGIREADLPKGHSLIAQAQTVLREIQAQLRAKHTQL